MPTPSWDNLDDFLGTDDFAVEATVTTLAGVVRRIDGIYDDKYMNAATGEYDTDSARPRFECKAAAVVGLRRGDVIDVPGEGRFELMTEPQNDGTGMAKLEMAPYVGP